MPAFDTDSPPLVSNPSDRVPATSENRIYGWLLDKHGPLIDVDKTWKLLGFKTRDAFNRAINQQRVPLRIIRPIGRKQSFVAAADLATYLASLASVPEENAM